MCKTDNRQVEKIFLKKSVVQEVKWRWIHGEQQKTIDDGHDFCQ